MKTHSIGSTLFVSSLLLGAASVSAPAFSGGQTPLVTISGVDHAAINVLTRMMTRRRISR